MDEGNQKVQNGVDISGGVDNKGFSVDAGDVKVAVTETSNTVPDNSKFTEKTDEALGIDRRFGYGPCKPKAAQFLNRIWILVIFLFIFCWLEGFAINGLVPAGLPAIERQFMLTSTKSALIPASQDFGALFVILFVSFIGGRYNKPIIIAIGSLIMALGSFIFVIPHIAQRYEWETSDPSGPGNPCDPDAGPGGPPCDSEGEKYVGVFVLSMILQGMGFTPMYTLGVVYLDDNSNSAAVHVGITYAAAGIGVASGFFTGGHLLQTYFVEFDRIDQDTLGFDARDTRWVGAWWVGMVITTIAFVVIAIPIFGYPKYMPGNKKAIEEESALKNEEDVTFGQLVKQVALSFFKAFLRLIKNPIYMFITLGGCTQGMIMFGVSAFSFKYLLEMYNISFDVAGNYLGGLILVGSVGMFLGGAIIRVFKLQLLGMIRLNIVVIILSALLGISFLAKCPEANLAGLRVPYPGDSSISGYSSACHSSCSCDGVGFNPVCGDDNKVYYSGCHAGCTIAPETPMDSYYNCSCVEVSLQASQATHLSNSTAAPGRCEDDCTSLNIVLPCLYIMMLLNLTVTTPVSMATLRCVDEDLKPFALALGWVLFRLLGSIPGPVFLGAVIDRACELWESGMCGGDGVCMLYNKADLALNMTLWWVLLTGVTALFFIMGLVFAMRRSKGSFELANNNKQ